jgi:tetratricopeptide (TPR) repeat protein
MTSVAPVIAEDKLGVFVSSTIGECAAERKAAKNAIISINHRPILFEGIGARPHPPRRVYLSLMSTARIFVGIYKSSYGWVGPGSSVSGVEDEFREARSRGLPMLIYISANPTAREDRLTQLLEEFKELAEFKYAQYVDDDALYSLIRDDLTAAITERFTLFPTASLIVRDDPSRALETIIASGLTELVRGNLLSALDRKLSEGPVFIAGPMGSGKSILLAQAAKRGNYLYASGANLSKKDVLIKCAGILREYREAPLRSCPDVETAIAELRDSAASAGSFTLCIDDCPDPELVLDALLTGGDTARRRVCVSGRAVPGAYTGAVLLVNPLSEDEIRAIAPHANTDISELKEKSAGNPLYVRYFVTSGYTYLDSLERYELRAFSQLSSRARELCSFVALAPTVLGILDLTKLLAVDSVEDVVSLSQDSAGMLVATSLGYRIFHDHIRDTIIASLRKEPSRRSYYGGRLADYYANRHQFLEAFELLEEARSDLADRYVARAAFDAQLRGDVKRTRKALNRQLEIVRKSNAPADEARVLLSLSNVEDMAGAAEESRAMLERASIIADRLGDADLFGFVQERQVILEARHLGGRADAMQRLEALRDAVAGNDDEAWNAGRLSLELSAIWIHNGNADAGGREASRALELFRQTQDKYGQHLAERNLASAYSASSDQVLRARGAELLLRIEREHAYQDNPRNKAWALNLRTRKARTEGRPEVAVSLATEAIGIAEALGDANIIIVNRINLGNALMDLAKPEEALKSYQMAAEMASNASSARTEAHATRLMASALRALGKLADAQVTAVRARDRATACGASYIVAEANDELGDVLRAMGKLYASANAYLSGARALHNDETAAQYFSALSFYGTALLSEEREWRDLGRWIDELFESQEAIRNRRSDLSSFEIDVLRSLAVARRVRPEFALGCAAAICRSMFRAASPRLQAAAVLMAARQLLRPSPSADLNKTAILAIACMLTFVEPRVFSQANLLEIAELLEKADPKIHFRPMDDGAAYWLMRLKWGAPILCCIRQLDDRPDIFIATWLIVAILSCFEDELTREIMPDPEQVGREVSVWVTNETEAVALIPQVRDVLGGKLETTSGVTRPTDFDGKMVPTFVICRDDISGNWTLATSEPGALHLLLSQIISELTYVLCQGEIDEEVLHPKVVRFVSRALRA